MKRLIEDAARDLQDPDHVRWTVDDLFAYANQTFFDLVRHRPDACTETLTLCLVEGCKQAIPEDSLQLIRLERNVPSNRAVRMVATEALDAALPQWQNREPANVIREYGWRMDEPRTFWVYPPAKADTRVEALVARHPAVVEPPLPAVDWTDSTIESLTRRDAGWLLSALSRDLIIGRDWSIRSFAEGLFDLTGKSVISAPLQCPTRTAWGYLEDALEKILGTNSTAFASVQALLDNLRAVFNDPESYLISKPVEPASYGAFTASESAYDTIMDEVLNTTLIDDMYDDLVANGNAACGDSVDWTVASLEDLTKRDAKGILTGIARDLLHGNDQATRTNAEYLFNADGTSVFDPQLVCGVKHTWDYLITHFQGLLSTNDQAVFEGLINDVLKATVDNPQPGLVKVQAPDVSADVTEDVTAGQTIHANRDRLIDWIWQRLVKDGNNDCPPKWPPLPVNAQYRDLVRHGILYRAYQRNTDAVSIEKANYHQQLFEQGLGIQQAGKLANHPARRQAGMQRKEDDE